MSAMLTLEDAQARLLALAPAMPAVSMPVEAALGRYLASDLRAARTQPPADLSAMDGYAVSGDGPWERVGESRAGSPFDGSLRAGQCVRISTGALMPGGADRVLIQENAQIEGSRVELAAGEADPAPSQHVRRTGFDFADGDMVLPRGSRIGPGQVALALAAGHGRLEVHRAPSIAILDSGDELASDPALCGPHQIPASNGAMLSAMVRPLGAEVVRIGPVADDRDALAKALSASQGCDILITSGGASVGDHDLVQQALSDWGADIAFWKVAIKPGKPLMVATRGSQVILGLPGNPVSSFVTAFLFALPLVRAAMGASEPLPRSHLAFAAEPLPATGDRREFLRGVSDGMHVRLADSQDSSALRSLALADCLIDRPAGSPVVPAGEAVPVYYLHNG